MRLPNEAQTLEETHALVDELKGRFEGRIVMVGALLNNEGFTEFVAGNLDINLLHFTELITEIVETFVEFSKEELPPALYLQFSISILDKLRKTMENLGSEPEEVKV